VRGFAIARVTPDEAYASERVHQFAKEIGNRAPVLKEGEIVAVNGFGNVYRFDERSTGQLRAEIDRASDPIGVLVVADGANTLTPAAPGGYDPGNAGAQLALDDALAHGDVPALMQLPPQILGRVAFQVLAGLTGPEPRSAKELYRGAPYGVGYFAGVWQL